MRLCLFRLPFPRSARSDLPKKNNDLVRTRRGSGIVKIISGVTALILEREIQLRYQYTVVPLSKSANQNLPNLVVNQKKHVQPALALACCYVVSSIHGENRSSVRFYRGRLCDRLN